MQNWNENNAGGVTKRRNLSGGTLPVRLLLIYCNDNYSEFRRVVVVPTHDVMSKNSKTELQRANEMPGRLPALLRRKMRHTNKLYAAKCALASGEVTG